MSYVPPHIRRRQQSERKPENLPKNQDKNFQEQNFLDMRRKLNSLINKINAKNLQELLPEFFEVNLIRARGIFCNILMKAQLAAPVKYTKLYASLVAVVNTKLPENGRLLIVRLIAQFRRGMRLNDKIKSIASVSFLAELINQRVAGEILGLQIAQLLLEKPTDASVEVAIEFIKQVGMTLDQIIPKGLHFIFESFRSLLQQSVLSKRVLFQIEALFSVRRQKFCDFEAIPEALDLVEEEDQITHDIGLDEPNITAQKMTELNTFSFDPNFIENEKLWENLQNEVLDDDSDSNDEEEESTNELNVVEPATNLNEVDAKLISMVNNGSSKDGVTDLTESDLISLRRVIYLTIMSSMNFEECCHKILKMKIPVGLEMEIVNMLIDCCSQEKVFEKFFGSLATRLCQLNQVYNHCFVVAFKQKLDTCHRLETNQLRNVSKLFAFIMFSDGLSWPKLLHNIKLSEEETTSSSRIFIKTLLQDLNANLGSKELKDRLFNKNHKIYKSGIEEWCEMLEATKGLFPRKSLEHARFAVNFLTVIGLGILTDDLREFIKNPPKALTRSVVQEEESDYSYDSDESASSRDKDKKPFNRNTEKLPASIRAKLDLINRRQEFIDHKLRESSSLSKSPSPRVHLKRRRVASTKS